MKNYKLYCLKNPETLEIRYIGITTQKYLSSRLSQHWYSANHESMTRVSKWIRSIKCKPLIEFIELCNEENWEDREKYWIKFYKNLTNTHEGGKGVIVDRSKTSIQRSALAHEKAIVQLNENGDLIKIWNSIKEATQYFNGKSKSSICNVLKNNYGAKRAFGYQWFYKDDYFNNNYKIRINDPKYILKPEQIVYLYDKFDNLIKEYKCIFHLSKEYNFTYTTCKKALKNNNLMYGKYRIRNYMI